MVLRLKSSFMYDISYSINEKNKRHSNSIYVTLGASNHTDEQRQVEDFYATDPIAAEKLLQNERFSNDIWECACGEGHLSHVFTVAGYNTRSSDLVNRNFGEAGVNFLSDEIKEWHGDVVTNPPYKHAYEFTEKALSIVQPGNKVAFLLRLQFLEGKKRQKFFSENPPKTVYVFSSRLQCAKNGEFERMKRSGGSAIAYAWFVWQKGFQGETTLKWIK